jgi:hypothetical protein
MMQDINELIEILGMEQLRVKMWLNENGFHHGTAPFIIAKRYRDELKQYLRLVMEDQRDGEYVSYRKLEDNFQEIKKKLGG